MRSIIDFVKWDPNPGEQLFAWRYPETNLSTYTQLIVAESQEALLFSKGEIIGKFGPGKHTLSTENLPLLRTLFGIPFGARNPFTAEVWFVNKLMPLNLDWTTDSMMYEDPDYQTMVPLLAKGRYGIKIIDAEKFLIKLVGTASTFTAPQLTENFYGATVAKTKSVLLQFIVTNKIGIKTLSAHLDLLSDNLRRSITSYWEDYGFDLISFYITTIEVDSNTDAGRAIMKAMTQQSAQVIGGYTWQQSQVFGLGDRAIDSMGGSNQGGLLSAIVATNLMGNMSGSGLLNPVAYRTPGNIPGTQMSPASAVHEVYCSNCARKFPNNVKFCPHCGDPYTPCPACGADNDSRAKKCVSCGSTLQGDANPDLPSPATEDSCKRCGTRLGNAAFCPNCGLKND